MTVQKIVAGFLKYKSWVICLAVLGKFSPGQFPPAEFLLIKLPPDNLPNPNLTFDGGIHLGRIDQEGIFRTPCLANA